MGLYSAGTACGLAQDRLVEGRVPGFFRFNVGFWTGHIAITCGMARGCGDRHIEKRGTGGVGVTGTIRNYPEVF